MLCVRARRSIVCVCVCVCACVCVRRTDKLVARVVRQVLGI